MQIFSSHGSWFFQCVLCSSFSGSPLTARFPPLGGSLCPPNCSCPPGTVYGTKVQFLHLLPVAHQPSLCSVPLSPSADWLRLKCQPGLIADLRLLRVIRLAFQAYGTLFGAEPARWVQGPSWGSCSAPERESSCSPRLVPTSLATPSALQWHPFILHSHAPHTSLLSFEL